MGLGSVIIMKFEDTRRGSRVIVYIFEVLQDKMSDDSSIT
jgi:hypothetical protein